MKKEIKEKIEGLTKIFDKYDLWEDENAEEILADLDELFAQEKQKFAEEIENKIIKEFTESQRCLNCGLLKKNWQGDLSSWCDDCLENE